MPISSARKAQYLDTAALAAIKPLDLRARMVVEGVMTGMHQSPTQGVSVEFAQHRQYAPGDDLRHLDWKVFGRTDKLYVKQQQRETNLDLRLLVDVSGSMGYGSVRAGRPGDPPWTKIDHAATAAAALAYLASRQQDRVGMTVFDEAVRNTTRLSTARGHWRSVVETLESEAGRLLDQGDRADVHGRSTDTAWVIDQVLAKSARRGLLVLISDLFDDPEVIERSFAKVYHRRHDLIVLQVLDPAERTFPFRAPTEFVGLETEGRLTMAPAALRASYLRAIESHLRRVADAARRFRFDYQLLDTSDSLGPTLSRYLARRASILRRRKH